jgi:hypothetical protein
LLLFASHVERHWISPWSEQQSLPAYRSVALTA